MLANKNGTEPPVDQAADAAVAAKKKKNNKKKKKKNPAAPNVCTKDLKAIGVDVQRRFYRI